MSTVPPFSPVNCKNEGYDFCQSLHHLVENYFPLGGKVIMIQLDRINATLKQYSSFCIETIFKVLSYGTQVIRQVGLWLWTRSVRLIQPLSQKLTNTQPFPFVNRQVQSELNALLNEKIAKRLYWIPHPKFEAGDHLHFPAQKVDFFALNGVKAQVFYFGRDKVIEILRRKNKGESIGHNEFLKWLNGNSNRIENYNFFQSDQECFMNCPDFVYLSLYQAGLISKEKILTIYQTQVCNEFNNIKSNTYYGFDLTLFKDFDPVSGAKGEVARPGDLLLGFEKGEPMHVLFLSGKNLKTGQWKSTSLWNMANKAPNPIEVELTALQKECELLNQSLTFKYCSLETALQSL
jgi:hypothetical protein